MAARDNSLNLLKFQISSQIDMCMKSPLYDSLYKDCDLFYIRNSGRHDIAESCVKHQKKKKKKN